MDSCRDTVIVRLADSVGNTVYGHAIGHDDADHLAARSGP